MKDGLIPPVDKLTALLRYDAETGKIYRRDSGREACATIARNGYLKGSLCNSRCYAHRVIWKLINGTEPRFIDHINGDVADNRLANLRAVEFADNTRNRKRPSNNTSGVIGVSWNARQKSWMAHIRHGGQRHAQWFKNKEDAVAWRRMMEARLGFHQNHGR